MMKVVHSYESFGGVLLVILFVNMPEYHKHMSKRNRKYQVINTLFMLDQEHPRILL
jgi:hypothetical protein